MNSSVMTAACFRIPRSVPVANSAGKGTTPVTFFGPIFQNNMAPALPNLSEAQPLESTNCFCP